MHSYPRQKETWPGYLISSHISWLSSVPPVEYRDSVLKQVMATSFQILTSQIMTVEMSVLALHTFLIFVFYECILWPFPFIGFGLHYCRH